MMDSDECWKHWNRMKEVSWRWTWWIFHCWKNSGEMQCKFLETCIFWWCILDNCWNWGLSPARQACCAMEHLGVFLFRFIIEYSSLRDFGPYVMGLSFYEDFWKMIFWLVLKLEISYRVIISWRIFRDFLKIIFLHDEIFEFL